MEQQQQQQQNNPPQLHTPNKSVSMPELSNLIPTIREVDADILEQGVEEKQDVDLADFDNQGRRLEARSESNISLSELLSNDINKFIEEEEELISLSHSLQSNSYDEHDDVQQQQQGGSLIIGSGENLDECRNDTSIANTQSPENIISTSDDIITTEKNMPSIAESESCHIPHPDNTKVEQPSSVAETESCSSNDWSFLDTISPPNQSGLYPTSKQLQQTQEIYHDELNKRIVSGRVHHRSVSFDRRISESAQFAEAVGEEPNTLLLKKIIEEDSSSDFDDDEIDEEVGDDLNDVEEDNGENHADLVDYYDDGQVEVIEQQHMPPPPIDNEMAAGESSSEVEPISTDIAKMSLKEGVCSSSNTINQELLSHLSASLEVDSAPTTPAPSPCKQSKVTTTSFHPPCYVDWKFTRQYSSGSNLNKDRGGSSVPNSPQEANNDFAYKGIRSKYLEVTKRGMARGNYAQLHRKAWLEVSDKHHRYGKNLRLYYKHWESIGHPYHVFFYWLDSIKEGAGNPLPSLPELPRSVLDSDTVLYITDPEISATYALDIVADPVDGSALILDQNGCPISTGKEGWIFVLRDHVLYGSQKVTAPTVKSTATSTEGDLETATAPVPRQRFHHSSFFGGKAVASAGIFLTDDQGRLTQLYPHSGHYRPGEAHMQRALFFFQQLGVDLSTFLVDMQQIFKVSRAHPPGKEAPAAATTTNKNGDIRKYFIPKNKENNAKTENGGKNPKHNKVKKSKKVDNLHLMCGLEVACFLAHKALMIEKGVFTQIHRIRRILPKESRNSVRLVLAFVNESC